MAIITPLSKLGLLATLSIMPLSSTAQEITLDVMHPYPAFSSFLEPLSKDFMQANPDVKVEFRLPPPDYDEAHLVLIRSALTGDLPDVYFAGYSVLRPMVEALEPRGRAVPLTEYMDSEMGNWVSENYDDAVLRLGQVESVQYAIPFNASTPIIYYNADLVERAGHDPDNIPTDWDGLIALARDIGALDSDIDGMDFSVAATGGDWIWQATLQSLGGDVVGPDGKGVGFDNETGLRALHLLRRVVEETDMNVATTPNSYRQQFFAGKLGYMIASPSAVSNFTSAVGGNFELRTAKFPVSEGGGLPTGGNAVAITAQDEAHRDAAWRFVKFVTGPKAQAFVAESTGYIPTNRQSRDMLSDFYAENPNFATAVEQVGLSQPWYSYAGGNASEIWRAQSEVIDRVQRGEVSPEDGLTQIVEATTSLIER